MFCVAWAGRNGGMVVSEFRARSFGVWWRPEYRGFLCAALGIQWVHRKADFRSQENRSTMVVCLPRAIFDIYLFVRPMPRDSKTPGGAQGTVCCSRSRCRVKEPSTESEGFSTKIDRAIGKLRTESQAIWLTRNIRRSLKGDKADQTHGAFGAKLQIRPLLTQTSQRLRDLRYDSAPGILWSRLGDAADGRANEGELRVFGRPRRPYLGRSCKTLVRGLLETEMDPMVILGPGNIESNGLSKICTVKSQPNRGRYKTACIWRNAAYERSSTKAVAAKTLEKQDSAPMGFLPSKGRHQLLWSLKIEDVSVSYS